jgi:lipid A disaccharide synthetase
VLDNYNKYVNRRDVSTQFGKEDISSKLLQKALDELSKGSEENHKQKAEIKKLKQDL